MVQSQCLKVVKYFHPKIRRAFARSQNCCPGKSEKLRICFNGTLFKYCEKKTGITSTVKCLKGKICMLERLRKSHKEGKCVLQCA